MEKQFVSTALLDGLRGALKKPNITGYRPHEIQERFHRSTAKGKLFLGGNRSGKTVGGGAESVFRLRGAHPYRPVPPAPVYGRGVAVNREEGLNKIMLPEIRRWLPPSLLINGSWEDSYHNASRILTLSNGSQMDFLTYEMDAEKHAGTSRNFVWLDEEPPEFIFNENLLRLADVNGDWWISMTPVLGMTWLYYKYYRPIVEERIPDDNVEIFLISTTDNPHVNEGVLDILTSGMSDAEKAARRHGTFMAATGLIYPEFHESIHVIDPLNIAEIARTYNVITGMDHGLRNPACWLWSYVDPDGRIIVFNEHYKSDLTVQDHVRVIRDFEGAYGVDPIYRIGDPAIEQRSAVGGGGSIRSEYADYGVFIGLGNNDVRYGLNRVRSYLQSGGLLITRNCVELIKEIRGYRWDSYSTRKVNETRELRDTPRKKNDHAVDALRYLICSRPEDEFEGAAEALNLPTMGIGREIPEEPITYEEYVGNSDTSYYHEILGDDW